MLKKLIKHKTLILILLPGILILWKLLLFLDLPYPNFDGVWSLSPTFSILSGNYLMSTFAHDFWSPFQFTPAYGYLSAIFFLILHPLSRIYSIFIYDIILIIIAIILSNAYLERKEVKSFRVKLIMFISFLTTTDIYNQRNELININLLLIILILLDINTHLSVLRIFFISLLTAIVGLNHPVGGIFAVGLFTCIAFKKRLNMGFYIKYYLLSVFFIAIIYIPLIMVNFDQWYINFVGVYLSSSGADYHSVSYSMMFKYFIISPFTFFPYTFLLFSGRYESKKILLELGFLLIVLFFISLFGRYYYFLYIYVFILWRASNWTYSRNINYKLILGFFLISPLLTHYIPTISQALNREYVINFRNVLNYVNTQNYFSKYDHVHVSIPISMPLIEYSNSRLIGQIPPNTKSHFRENDIALIVNYDALKSFKHKFELENSDFDIKLIFNSVEEKFPIYFRSKFEDKHVDMGLWEVKLKKSF